MRHRAWSVGCAGILGGLAAVPVQLVVASEYLSLEAAQKGLFPQADGFLEVALALSDEQRSRAIIDTRSRLSLCARATREVMLSEAWTMSASVNKK